MSRALKAVPLTDDNFRRYGQVISAKQSSVEANQGTAQRFNHVAQLENARGGPAKPNLCVFRSVPRQLPFEVKILERHYYSTQAFIPMMTAKSHRYLVVVALNGRDDKPDLSTLGVFLASATQGINYNAGCWHHPMIALDNVTDFACLVWEDNTSKDCQVESIEPSIWITVEGASKL
eukprot:Opistho-2@58271